MNTAIYQPASDLHPAPYTSRYVAAGGLQLHYLDYGTAGKPVILCIHGGAAHAHWFDFFARSVIADHHVLALNLRGHGDSEWMRPPAYTYELYVSDMAEVIERLGLQDFVLVGHSMGGLVSLLYQATHQGRARGLIVVDSNMRMSDTRAGVLRDIGARHGTRYATHEEFVRNFRLRPAGTTAAPEIVRHLATHSGRQLQDGSWVHKFDRHTYAQRNGLDGLPFWSRITVPALLVKSDRSGRLGPDLVADVGRLCPQVECVEVPNSDHHVFLDNPTGFAHVVKDFLNRTT